MLVKLNGDRTVPDYTQCEESPGGGASRCGSGSERGTRRAVEPASGRAVSRHFNRFRASESDVMVELNGIEPSTS